jgi:hypothetical protein
VDREPPGGTAIFITAHHLKKKKIQHTAGGTALRGGEVQEEFWLDVWYSPRGGWEFGRTRVARLLVGIGSEGVRRHNSP